MKNEYEFIRRDDDGSIDLYLKLGKGKLDFVSNHANLDEALNARDEMEKPIQPGDFEHYFYNFLKNHEHKTTSN